MNDIFCIYFDHNYLSRAMLTIRSLRRFEPNTPIYVLALSELCEDILRELALPKIHFRLIRFRRGHEGFGRVEDLYTRKGK